MVPGGRNGPHGSSHRGARAPAGTPPRSGRSGKGWLRGKSGVRESARGCGSTSRGTLPVWGTRKGMARGGKNGTHGRPHGGVSAPAGTPPGSGRFHGFVWVLLAPTDPSTSHSGESGRGPASRRSLSDSSTYRREKPPHGIRGRMPTATVPAPVNRHGRRGPPTTRRTPIERLARRLERTGKGGRPEAPTAGSFPVQRHQNSVTPPSRLPPHQKPRSGTHQSQAAPAPIPTETLPYPPCWPEYNDRLFTHLT